MGAGEAAGEGAETSQAVTIIGQSILDDSFLACCVSHEHFFFPSTVV